VFFFSRVTRDNYVAKFKKAKNYTRHFDYLKNLATNGKIDELKAISAELLDANSETPEKRGTVGSHVQYIIFALALRDGYENAKTALEITSVVDCHKKRLFALPMLKSVISKLVSAQSPDVLEALLRTYESDMEASACILHDAVVQRKLSANSEIGCEVQERLSQADHPLAVLPLTLFEFEQGVDLYNYSLECSSVSSPFGPSHGSIVPASSEGGDRFEFRETTESRRTELISAAIENWVSDSGGIFEARTFRLNGSDAFKLSARLPKLGLECVGNKGVNNVNDGATLQQVFRILFAAASHGGAYGGGLLPAYGRLHAWRSLAGLVGASSDLRMHDIAKQARACRWCLFESDCDWYEQVAWDIGIACFNPARSEIAILAATDTD